MRSEWHWFVRCDLQIFSGCVCHFEQLHTQSPFLFPIVFSINNIQWPRVKWYRARSSQLDIVLRGLPQSRHPSWFNIAIDHLDWTAAAAAAEADQAEAAETEAAETEAANFSSEPQTSWREQWLDATCTAHPRWQWPPYKSSHGRAQIDCATPNPMNSEKCSSPF